MNIRPSFKDHGPSPRRDKRGDREGTSGTGPGQDETLCSTGEKSRRGTRSLLTVLTRNKFGKHRRDPQISAVALIVAVPLDTRASILFALSLSRLSSIYVLSRRCRSPFRSPRVDVVSSFPRTPCPSIHKNGLTLASHVETRDDNREIGAATPRFRYGHPRTAFLWPPLRFLLKTSPGHYAPFSRDTFEAPTAFLRLQRGC